MLLEYEDKISFLYFVVNNMISIEINNKIYMIKIKFQ